MDTDERTIEAGCYTCFGDAPKWTAPNSKGVAARHRDLTGHTTWIRDITIFKGTEKAELEALGQRSLLPE